MKFPEMANFKGLSLLVFIMALSWPGRTQSPLLIDSLERNLSGFSEEQRVTALYRIISFYQRSDLQKAKDYRNQMLPYLKSRDPRMVTYARMTEGIISSSSGSLDSSIYWFEQAKGSAQEIRDPHLSASICSSLGRTLIAAGKAEKAVSTLLEGLRLTDQAPDREQSIRLRINLIWAYLELKRFRDGIHLGRQTLGLIDSTLQWMALYIYNNVAVCYGAEKQLDSARYFVSLGIRAAEANKDYHALANGHFILGSIYSDAGRNDLAIKEYEAARPFREKAGDPLYIVSDLYTLASLYQKTGNYAKGIKTGLQALSVAQEHHLLLKFENTYQVLAMNYAGVGDFVNASKYYELWAEAKDSVYQQANAQAIADMETRYETEKKEQQIALQNATIATQKANIQRDYILIIGLVIVVLLVVTILLLLRSRMQRRQEILAREHELALQRTYLTASLESQETERKRFAQDIHDGMGQLISALHFIVGRSAAQDASGDLSKATSILNDMHREIRNIAYNLMPQVLIRDGILAALKEMSARVTETGQLAFTVSSFECPSRFTELTEISLYRIIQEWVNNILKYAHAGKIELQMVGHEGELTITIEDDGDGFDVLTLDQSKGNGWKNIQSRVNLLGATIDVDSMPGRKGTTLTVTVSK